MQDYERLINYFFTYCNVTITSRYIERLLKKSKTEYSVSYLLKSHPVDGYNKELVKFDFKEDDDSILMYVSYPYSKDDKYGLSIDGSLLNKEMALGRKSMLFFESIALTHYCPTMCINFKMNKKSKETLFLLVYQTINIRADAYSATLVNLEDAINEITDQELILMHEDPTGMTLDDKLCLLAMVKI